MTDLIVQYLHVLAAMVLVGSALFIGLILVSVARKEMEPKARMQLLSKVGHRAKWFGWGAIAVLAGTGLYRIKELIGTPLWDTGYGRILMGKIHWVLLYLVLAILHDFVLGPKMSKMDPADPKSKKIRVPTLILAKFQVLVLLTIVFYAVRLRMFSW